MKTTSCNGQEQYAFNKALRCGAKTKSNNGLPCQAPAVRNKKRCRMHGGSRGSGGQQGNSNALKHGFTTMEIKSIKKAIKTVIRETEQLTKDLQIV